MCDVLLETKDIVKQFPASRGRTLTACNNINLQIFKGKTLGIIGESGCGKSTLARLIIQLDEPTRGEILYGNKNIIKFNKKERWEIRENMQMVFQDPLASFNPRMKVVDILTESLLNYNKIQKSEKVEKAKDLLRMVELSEDFLYRYPHNMSGGQRQRISIGRALSLNPEILICDEATSALDVSVQDSIVKLLIRLQEEKQISILFICHDPALVHAISHNVAVMYLGNIVEYMPGELLPNDAKHPYTLGLVNSVFPIHMNKKEELKVLKGDIPSPLEINQGCPFQSRCENFMDICLKKMPKLVNVDSNHSVACHRFEK